MTIDERITAAGRAQRIAYADVGTTDQGIIEAGIIETVGEVATAEGVIGHWDQETDTWTSDAATSPAAQATDTQLATIRARRIDDNARAMMVDGVTLTHAQAAELGDDGLAWIADRLGLSVVETDIGVECSPYAPACDRCGHPIAALGVTLDADDDVDTTGQDRLRCSDTACTC